MSPHSTIKKDDARLDHIAKLMAEGIEPKWGDVEFLVDLCQSMRVIHRTQAKVINSQLKRLNDLQGKDENEFV